MHTLGQLHMCEKMCQTVTPCEHNILALWGHTTKRQPCQFACKLRCNVAINLHNYTPELCLSMCRGKVQQSGVDRVTAEARLADLSPPQQCVESGLFYTHLLQIQHWVIAAPLVLTSQSLPAAHSAVPVGCWQVKRELSECVTRGER